MAAAKRMRTRDEVLGSLCWHATAWENRILALDYSRWFGDTIDTGQHGISLQGR